MSDGAAGAEQAPQDGAQDGAKDGGQEGREGGLHGGLQGGCHCGAVRYEAGGTPALPTLCHCVDCRRVSGAPAVAWFTVPRGAFRLLRGTPRRYASSSRAERGFCGDCGTPLTWAGHDSPEEIDVATATLDEPAAVPPADHVRTASAIPWARPCDGLPAYPGSRNGG